MFLLEQKTFKYSQSTAVQSQGQAQSEPRYLKAVSTMFPRYCGVHRAKRSCCVLGEQGCKKSRDSVSVDCHRYLKFITHFNLNSFLLTVHLAFFHSCKNFPHLPAQFSDPIQVHEPQFQKP